MNTWVSFDATIQKGLGAARIEHPIMRPVPHLHVRLKLVPYVKTCLTEVLAQPEEPDIEDATCENPTHPIMDVLGDRTDESCQGIVEEQGVLLECKAEGLLPDLKHGVCVRHFERLEATACADHIFISGKPHLLGVDDVAYNPPMLGIRSRSCRCSYICLALKQRMAEAERVRRIALKQWVGG